MDGHKYLYINLSLLVDISNYKIHYNIKKIKKKFLFQRK